MRSTTRRSLQLDKTRPPIDDLAALPDPTFGKWRVLSFAGWLNSKNEETGVASTTMYWLCRCTCGVERLVPKGNLVRGLSHGCNKCAAAARHEKYLTTPRGKLFTELGRRQYNRLRKFWRAAIDGWATLPEFAEFMRQQPGWPGFRSQYITRKDKTKPHGPGNTQVVEYLPLSLRILSQLSAMSPSETAEKYEGRSKQRLYQMAGVAAFNHYHELYVAEVIASNNLPETTSNTGGT